MLRLICLGAASLLTIATPLRAHAAEAARKASPVVVSELQVDPLLLTDAAGEYVELVNLGDRPLPIATLAVIPPSGRRIQLQRPRFPILPPGAVVVVRRRPRHACEAAAPGLALPDRAGRLQVLARGVVVDTVHWMSTGPGPRRRAGRSLERRHPRAPGEYGRSWRHSRKALRRVERGSPGTLTWSCAEVAGTGLARACRASPSKR